MINKFIIKRKTKDNNNNNKIVDRMIFNDHNIITIHQRRLIQAMIRLIKSISLDLMNCLTLNLVFKNEKITVKEKEIVKVIKA